MWKPIPIVAFLLLVSCGAREGQQNAVELAIVAEEGANRAAAPATAAAASRPAAPQPSNLSVGPLRVRYESSLLTPVPTRIQLPPDWTTEVDGTKLVGKDRAALLGKGKCMYGQAGQATTCNAEQEAGLAFADLEGGWIEGLRRAVPPTELKKISLAGVDGVSWQIGAEGEGAEYILLPAMQHTVLIVRQFRNTGNPDKAALGAVLNGLKLPE